MACTPEYIEFVCAQLHGVGVLRSRRMFGDWCIYVDEKPVILACDGQCYVKMHAAIADLMQEAQTGYPYEGAKLHYLLDVDHGEQARAVVRQLVAVLPYPKTKKRK